MERVEKNVAWGFSIGSELEGSMEGVRILASVLGARPLFIQEDVSRILALGVDGLHVDIMDGHYVPNISFGPTLLGALASAFPDTFLDTHLMISNVEAEALNYVKAGTKQVSFHIETALHAHRLITLLRQNGAKVGIALNPLTPLCLVEDFLPFIDHLLVMSVNPGFGGQSFIPASVGRVERLRATADREFPQMRIQVDGGVNEHNAKALVSAGANDLIMGTALFASDAKRIIDTVRHI